MPVLVTNMVDWRAFLRTVAKNVVYALTHALLKPYGPPSPKPSATKLSLVAPLERERIARKKKGSAVFEFQTTPPAAAARGRSKYTQPPHSNGPAAVAILVHPSTNSAICSKVTSPASMNMAWRASDSFCTDDGAAPLETLTIPVEKRRRHQVSAHHDQHTWIARLPTSTLTTCSEIKSSRMVQTCVTTCIHKGVRAGGPVVNVGNVDNAGGGASMSFY